MSCTYCRKEIDRKIECYYYSRQAGMKGPYHWKCFVEACHESNKIGANDIEIALSFSSTYEHSSVFELSEN